MGFDKTKYQAPTRPVSWLPRLINKLYEIIKKSKRLIELIWTLRYVTRDLIQRRIQEEYEVMKETEDGPVDYPIDGGDDGDNDDDDSSGDDADGEDEDEEDEDEEDKEDHLALADSTIVVPVHEPVFPPEGTEPAEVERLLAMTTPSPPISLSPPSAGEHLVRDEIPESEQTPRKRSCLSTLGSRYKVGESSTARPTRGRGIDYGFVSTGNVKRGDRGLEMLGTILWYTWVDPAEAVPEIVPMTVGEVNTRVTELAELHDRDTHDLYALQEDAQYSRSRISQRVDMDSQWVNLLMGDRMTLKGQYGWQTSDAATPFQTHHQVHETRFQMQQAELAALRETDRRRQDQMQRRARQPGPEARIPEYQDTSGDADSHI
ncbi:hypothetical protein Tco_0189238 [Tanacetum coccineum]